MNSFARLIVSCFWKIKISYLKAKNSKRINIHIAETKISLYLPFMPIIPILFLLKGYKSIIPAGVNASKTKWDKYPIIKNIEACVAKTKYFSGHRFKAKKSPIETNIRKNGVCKIPLWPKITFIPFDNSLTFFPRVELGSSISGTKLPKVPATTDVISTVGVISGTMVYAVITEAVTPPILWQIPFILNFTQHRTRIWK